MSKTKTTARKMIKMVLIAGIICIVVFIVGLYGSIKTKSTNISKYEPFKELIDKSVDLKRDIVLFKELRPLNNNYPYTMIDSLHPLWENYHNRATGQDADVIKFKTVMAGATIRFEKAINYTNGVSGGSSPMLLGTINNGEKEYKIDYQWGEKSPAKFFDGVAKCWFFHIAPWQLKKDARYFEIPDAKWW